MYHNTLYNYVMYTNNIVRLIHARTIFVKRGDDLKSKRRTLYTWKKQRNKTVPSPQAEFFFIFSF